MDRQQIGLKLALDALGIPVRLDSFADRLTVQKCVYLSQAAGIQLGYTFHWYLRGPYSPTLTRDAFGVVAELGTGADESQGWNLDPASVKRAANLRRLIQSVQGEELATKLELLASVHFLVDAGAGRKPDIAELHSTLHRYGKHFSEDDVRKAVEELNQYELGPAVAS
ncbi:MAG TPA: hypothetical protein VGM05_26710 [Planctomycetaceae bacterium]|jgi:uncharacterized protein YwgA